MMISFSIICEKKTIYNNKTRTLILSDKTKLKINCILIKTRGPPLFEIKDYLRA